MLRFVQEDKIGYGGGANLYAYVGGAVLDARDPGGTLPVYEKYMWCYECMQGGGSWADSFMWIGSILPVQVTYVMLGDRRIGRIDAPISSVLDMYDNYVSSFSAERTRQLESKRTIALAISGNLTGLTLKDMFESASALSAGEFGALIGRWGGFRGSRSGSGVLAQRGAMGIVIDSRLAHGTIFNSPSFVHAYNQVYGSDAVGWTGSIYTALGALSSRSIIGAVVHESLHYLGYPGSEGQVWERTNIIMGSGWSNPWGW